MELTQERLHKLIAAEEVAFRIADDSRRALAVAEHQYSIAKRELLEYRRRMDIAERTRLAVELEQRRAAS